MAMYSFNASIVRRSVGQSVVDRTAYILRSKLYDSYTGRTYNRRSRSTHVLESGVYLPPDAPPEFKDVQKLLTALNSAETRSNAQMARSYHLALPILPIELAHEQYITLAEEFMDKHFAQVGQCAIYAIHLNPANSYGRESPDSLPPVDEIKANPHLHIVVPFRMVNSDGFLPTKTASRMMNNRAYLVALRKSWADIQNRAFERLGLAVRVSHESLVMQEVNRKPVRYLGAAAIALERKGIKTDRGDQYRDIIQQNKKLRQPDRSVERSYGPTR